MQRNSEQISYSQLHSTNLLKNDGSIEIMEKLLKFKSILIEQLNGINVTSIVKNVFDKVHYSLIFFNPQEQVLCGVCYRIFEEVSMANIVYFAANSKYQGYGHGSKLMTAFKNQMKFKNIRFITTHADNSSLSFYQKLGFIKHKKQNKRFDSENEIWQLYLEDYTDSQLMVSQIKQTIDYDHFKNIVKKQYQNALQLIDGFRYHNFIFSKQQLQVLTQKDVQKYFESKGRKYISKQNKVNNEKLLDVWKEKLISTKQIVGNLEQISLLEIIKDSKNSWLMSFNFGFIPSGLMKTVSKVIILQEIQEKVLNNCYSSSIQMCSEVKKALTNLKYILPADTLYLQTLKNLQKDILPTIQQILNGTFNQSQHFQKLKSKNKFHH